MFAELFIALYAGHAVGDHWVQTSHQAGVKGEIGWRGRRACAAHVATYTATQVFFLAAAGIVLHLHVSSSQFWAGLAVSAVTHYFADRRAPLRRLARLLGSEQFYDLGRNPQRPCLGTGAYALDQSWHIGWLFVAALIMSY